MMQVLVTWPLKSFFCADNTLIACLLQELENSLNEFGMPWTLNPGDGAFYGPKVDNF